MKKHILFIILAICSLFVSAQESIFPNSIHKFLGENILAHSTLVGKSIRMKFSSIGYSENFLYSSPDTLWIKKKKNPVLNKHYRLITGYKGIENKKYDYIKHDYNYIYTTPLDSLKNKTFKVLRVSKNPSARSYSEIYNIHLHCMETGDNIIWRYTTSSDEAEKGIVEVSSIDEICKRELINKVFYKKKDKNKKKESANFIKTTCKNCKYDIDAHYFHPRLNISLLGENGIYYEHNTWTSTGEEIISEEEFNSIYQKEIASLKNKGRFHFVLSKVEKPKNPKIQYGKTIKTTDKESLKYLYEDNAMSILWSSTKSQFIFTLKNKSENNFKIIWDDAAFIDENNTANKIFHSGIKYTNRNESQTPTLIPKGSILEDLIAPIHRVFYSDGWHSAEMVDQSWWYNKSLENKCVKVLLPIETKGVVNEYTFTFKLEWRYDYPELRYTN